MYVPNPIKTSGITLPLELIDLTEKLAENVHEVWASQRVSSGWKYGDKESASEKTTPLLVPYDQLPESEKDYDRNTAVETIKMLIMLGYSIQKDN